MATNEVDVLIGIIEIKQGIGVNWIVIEAFAAHESHVIGVLQQSVGVLTHQIVHLGGGVEASGITYPPVGFVLNGYDIYGGIIALHISTETVEPVEELYISSFIQFAFAISL